MDKTAFNIFGRQAGTLILKQTEEQAFGQIGRQAESQTDIRIGMWADRQAGWQAAGCRLQAGRLQAGRLTSRQVSKQPNRHEGMFTGGQMSGKADRKAGGQAAWQT